MLGVAPSCATVEVAQAKSTPTPSYPGGGWPICAILKDIYNHCSTGDKMVDWIKSYKVVPSVPFKRKSKVGFNRLFFLLFAIISVYRRIQLCAIVEGCLVGNVKRITCLEVCDFWCLLVGFYLNQSRNAWSWNSRSHQGTSDHIWLRPLRAHHRLRCEYEYAIWLKCESG